jgi:arylsulfatase A-like enzyme
MLLQAWAALEYLDGAIGKIFDFVRSSGLASSTYIMLLSDNGSALMSGESAKVSCYGDNCACDCMWRSGRATCPIMSC